MDNANNNEHQVDSRELRALAEALEGELERLKENLETHRLLDHAQQRSVVQQLIADIDERQDRLSELQLLIAEQAPAPALTPLDAVPTKH